MGIGTRRERRPRSPTLRVLLPPEDGEDSATARHPARTKPKRRLPPEVLTDTEVCALMEACGRYAPTGVRTRALIALLYRAGLRINEALSLYPKDLDLPGGSVRVLYGKGGRARTVGIDPGAAVVIERWLDVRSRLGLTGRQPLFCTLHGRPMAAAYIRVLLQAPRSTGGHRQARPRPRLPPYPRRTAPRRRR